MNGDVLTNRSARDRNKTDYYPTPPEVTEALLNFLEERKLLLKGDWIWEPACGTGEMAEVMRQRGYSVAVSDLYRTDYVAKQMDFLENNLPSNWIITNPPFSLAEEFIRHALELDKPCAFLLKSQFWHARKRLSLFRNYPPSFVLPLTWRPDFLCGAKGGSPTMECIWTVWCTTTDAPAYIPLEKPQERSAAHDAD